MNKIPILVTPEEKYAIEAAKALIYGRYPFEYRCIQDTHIIEVPEMPWYKEALNAVMTATGDF